MNIHDFISNWAEAGNAFDTNKYLNFYDRDAILDDPSVGKKFSGHEEIKEYFDNYFIGYNTHTEIVQLKIIDEHHAYLKVKFTGDFPEGTIGGTFEFTFNNGKISYLKADLIY